MNKHHLRWIFGSGSMLAWASCLESGHVAFALAFFVIGAAIAVDAILYE